MVGSIGRSEIEDAEVDAFVDANVISFAAWDLIAYLSQRPSEPSTLAGLMRLLSRGAAELEPVLDQLTANGVLVESPLPDGPTYMLTSDAGIRDVMARFVTMSKRREYRLEFVRRVLGQITGG